VILTPELPHDILEKVPVTHSPWSTPTTSQPVASDTPPADSLKILFCLGIDWADGEHDYVMLDPQGKTHRDSVEQSAEAIVHRRSLTAQ
jgi:hypothetical protein